MLDDKVAALREVRVVRCSKKLPDFALALSKFALSELHTAKLAAFMQECHCMLFLTEDNGFRGEERAISIETIEEATKGLSGVQP